MQYFGVKKMTKNTEKIKFPCFSDIKPEKINEQLQKLLAEHQQKIEKLFTEKELTWKTFIEPLQELNNRLDHFWGPIDHLHAVSNKPALRKAYQAAVQTLTQYTAELEQNPRFYQCYKAIADSDNFKQLTSAQQKVIKNALRAFHLAGVDLNPEQKSQFCQLQQRLADLTTQFDNNVLDATEGWYLHLENEEKLTGIPDYACQSALQTAQKKHKSGWIFTLDFPSYSAVMSFAKDRDIRQQCYTAYATRCSDQGPTAKQWNNDEIMQKILQARYEKAELLGFKHYTEYSLATKMAKEPTKVFAFLYDLLEKSKIKAQEEYQQLRQFAKQYCQIDEMQAWDVAYVSEKMQQHLFNISQQQLRPFFPENQVIEGLFTIVNRLFGISCHVIEEFDRWDPQIRLYAVHDAKGELCGHFYFDLYARENKRGGAWVNDCFSRMKRINNQIQTPIAFVNCNFAPPTADTPCLLTHDDVITLFHEFGHCLHHVLTKIDTADISGINGVEWDAVELPSQFLENWCWHKESLAIFAKHYQTKEELPHDLFTKLTDLKYFQGAMKLLRQVEYALFDFTLHHEFTKTQKTDIQAVIDKIREQTAIIHVPKYNRFQNSFSHIFAGGYAAGYYSYLWAEVLSADAFSRFSETSLFDKQASQDFLHDILERGGSKDMLECFIDFRGREPQNDALLKEYGIA